jgi:alkanesulfonate monooxygenase SsuD/methylene tetrahydromethanopterin reductase-like flavin-dependent oxidoreductase (luciferase family)
VGVGWLREEIEACGTAFDTRGRRADEQLEVLRALWDDRPCGVSHHGEFFDFDDVMCYPKPIAGKNLPVHIGGHSPGAARRAGRRGDGFQPLGVAGAQLDSLLALMRDEASAARIDAERAGRLADQGVLAMPPIADIERAKDALSACGAVCRWRHDALSDRSGGPDRTRTSIRGRDR